MKKFIGLTVLAVTFGMMPFQDSLVFAAEAGFGHYVPGAIADFGDMAPPSGFALVDWYNHYDGSAGAGRQLEFGGLIAANVSAKSNAEMFGGIYTFPCSIFGGKYSAGVIVPYLWMDVTGTLSVTGPLGRTFTVTRTDTASGIGDLIFMPFWLTWNCGDFRWGTQLNVYAPTGEYNRGQLANVGLNYWTFEPMASFSYISKKIGLEITTTAGFDFNIKYYFINIFGAHFIIPCNSLSHYLRPYFWHPTTPYQYKSNTILPRQAFLNTCNLHSNSTIQWIF